MAVRDDFAAGEVLAAADLNDTFASKPAATYGTAEPSSPATGDIWYDSNDDPATPKFYDGTEFVNFPSGAGDAVISSPAATGQYTDGSGDTWDYYTFTASGTLTVDTAGFADVLVVGGGGGGADGASSFNRGGGGGGAGDYRYATSVYIPAGNHTVTVGAGAAGRAVATTEVGSASVLGDITQAIGGGSGGPPQLNSVADGQRGESGGSGGGGTSSRGVTNNGGSAMGWQGNSGGYTTGDGKGGGGGGGAGSAGGDTSTGTGGTGGSGVSNSITGSSVTYCAGGAGGDNSGNAAGAAGAANTGNGGAGGEFASGAGGNGGSGVVIVRVKV